MKTTGRYLIGWIVFLVAWTILALKIQNDILLASPKQVLEALMNLLMSQKFYVSVLTTTCRVLSGFLLSLSCALIVYFLGKWKRACIDFLNPILVLAKSIPNISYMIIAILWLGSEGSVTLIIFMILFPIFLQAFETEDAKMPQGLQDIMLLHNETYFYQLWHYLLPNLVPTILLTAKTTMSFGFKVGVMAEILSSVRVGIGRQMRVAQINLWMSSILAWTIVIILISVGIDLIFNFLLHRIHEREYNL